MQQSGLPAATRTGIISLQMNLVSLFIEPTSEISSNFAATNDVAAQRLRKHLSSNNTEKPHY